MTSALIRGRTLNPEAVREAKKWRKERLSYLLGKSRLALTPKEHSEARSLTGKWRFWEATND